MIRQRRVARALGFASLIAFAMPCAPASALIVFDPSNLAQNALQAERSLQQITNQIHALQNQATMIEGMIKNLDRLNFTSLPQMTGALNRVTQLMAQAQGIGFQIDQTQKRVSDLFPGSAALAGTNAAAQSAAQRLATVRSAFQDSMTVQSRIVTEAGQDATTLADLVGQSQAAHGGLQAQQATNQLLALVAKQQIAFQAMQASQSRADAMANAMHIQEQSDGQAAVRRFLGTGHDYTRQ